MFQWAVSLEITGACPAPSRFYSELFTLHQKRRASDFQRYQDTCPQWENRFQIQAAFFSSQCACPALPILSMVGWNLFSPQLTWPRPSLKSKKFHLNTSIRMTYNNICKTTRLSTVNNSILMFFRPTHWFMDTVNVCLLLFPSPILPTDCNSSVLSSNCLTLTLQRLQNLT